MDTVVENSVSGSLRGYTGLSRFMDLLYDSTVLPSGNLSTRSGNNVLYVCRHRRQNE